MDASKDLFQSSINDGSENPADEDPNNSMFDKLEQDLEDVDVEVGQKVDEADPAEGSHSSKDQDSEGQDPDSEAEDLEKQFEAEMKNAGLQMKDLSIEDDQGNAQNGHSEDARTSNA